MSKSFPNYDIDSVLKDATPFQVLDWFVKNMPAEHEPEDHTMFPEERVPRDIWLLDIMWGNAFYALVIGCDGGQEYIYRANAAIKLLPPSKASAAVGECVSILNTFGLQDEDMLIPYDNPEFEAKMKEFDTRHFYNGNLWAESHTLARDTYQFILEHLDVYRRRRNAA